MKTFKTIAEAQAQADIINQAGNRIKNIVVVEVCENCGIIFFGQPQDRSMRIGRGVPTLCNSCRQESLKSRRRKGNSTQSQPVQIGKLGLPIYEKKL